MENAVLMQLYSFFIYIASGIIIGIFFDIFRILRKSFHTSDIITYIEDILFWILTGFFLIFVLFKFSNGEIRIYNIIGLLVGGIFYLLCISHFFIKINVIIVTFIKNIVYKILKIILYPLKIIFNGIKKLFTPFTFFVINLNKIIFKNNIKIKNNTKKEKKFKKSVTERRILKENVEKYN